MQGLNPVKLMNSVSIDFCGVPAGGATALIAAIANPKSPWAGFEYVIGIFIGCLAMLLVALIVNNWHRTIRYPTFWW